MTSSLVPERPLIISPTLASTIGLEEAVMLHVLAESIHHLGIEAQTQDAAQTSAQTPAQVASQVQHSNTGRRFQQGLQWLELSQIDLNQRLPFWAPLDIRRVQNSLQNLGLIVIDANTNNVESYWYAINQTSPATKTPVNSQQHSPQQGRTQSTQAGSAATPAPRQAHSGEANLGLFTTSAKKGAASNYMQDSWQPDAAWVKQCLAQNIPEEFVRALVPEFVVYWRERGKSRFSWGNAFYKHVIKQWRGEQTRRGTYESATVMSAAWRPSEAAMDIMEKAEVNSEFIEDAIPEFVLYWRERGIVNGTWNTKFIEHVRKQWAKFSASFGYDDKPQLIPANWQPSADCYLVLELAEIDADYARSKIPEFILYWQDSQKVKASWNTVFIQFIKQDWARRLKQLQTAESANAEDQSVAGDKQQSLNKRIQRFADRSWAE